MVSAIAPVIACAFCPACLATFTKLLSLVGTGLAMTEAEHTALLTSALCVSVAASAWYEQRAARRLSPRRRAAAACDSATP